jgi:hypothetical protein
VAAAGSQSPAALHDPLFWGVVAAAALVSSAAVGRWPAAAGAAAAFAGGCTMLAILLPVVPSFDVSVFGDSLRAMANQFGVLGALGLLGVWLQAIALNRATSRIAAAARGALLVALMLMLAGALPGGAIDARVWVLVLAVLLGLVEAKARYPADAASSERQRAIDASSDPSNSSPIARRTSPPTDSSDWR